MQLSSYSDYTLRVLMYAALRRPDWTTVGEVAGAFDVSRNHLVKVVHVLGRHGFLATRRGVGGGFTLGMPPAEIGLGAVVRLTEATEQMMDCTDRYNRACRISQSCRLRDVLDEAAAAFFAVLDRYSLEDLLQQPKEMKRLLKI